MPAPAPLPEEATRPAVWPAWLDSFRAGVVLVTAGVATFLLAQLHSWPPHEDETLALFVGRQPLGDLFDTVLGERGGAPLHFLLTHLVGIVSPGLTGLRLLSVFFAVASIPVIAALIARLAGRRTALVATVLVATSWTLLFHGIYGRMYSLFLFASALSFLALLNALASAGWRRWGVWGVVMLATLASMPYGAMVLAVQGVYVAARRLRHRFSLLPALVAFAAVTLIAIPLWRTYLRLAARFDVGVGGERASSLDSPLDVLVYVREVIGDFTAGWVAGFAVMAAVAAFGLLTLVRTRTRAALLAGTVFAVPAVALMLARLGSAAVPETRHLIFALPFFAMLVGAGLLRLAAAAGRKGSAVVAIGLAVLVSSQIAWGWQKTPALYAGEAPERTEAREDAAAFLSTFLRRNDLLWGYHPLFLEASERSDRVGDLVVPRADSKLALRALTEARQPLGRAVWVHDASNNGITRRFEIPEKTPAGEEFAARAFGPFLVIWTTVPERTPAAYLRDTISVQQLGIELGVSDAELNYETAVLTLDRLEG